MKKQGTLEEIVADIGNILKLISQALQDQEKRLRLLEELYLKPQLQQLKTKMKAISDPNSQTEALQTLKSLCDSLGIADLE